MARKNSEIQKGIHIAAFQLFPLDGNPHSGISYDESSPGKNLPLGNFEMHRIHPPAFALGDWCRSDGYWPVHVPSRVSAGSKIRRRCFTYPATEAGSVHARNISLVHRARELCGLRALLDL